MRGPEREPLYHITDVVLPEVPIARTWERAPASYHQCQLPWSTHCADLRESPMMYSSWRAEKKACNVSPTSTFLKDSLCGPEREPQNVSHFHYQVMVQTLIMRFISTIPTSPTALVGWWIASLDITLHVFFFFVFCFCHPSGFLPGIFHGLQVFHVMR